MGNDWFPANIRPKKNCEVFVLAKVIDDYYGNKKGEIILQRDSYDAEYDCFGESDDERLQIICWHFMDYPEVPDPYRGKAKTIFNISHVVN